MTKTDIVRYENEPKEVISYALERAKLLAEVIREKKLFTLIAGKEFVNMDGWTLLGQMCGISAVLVEVKEYGEGFLATVKLRQGDRVVGAATSYCGSDEPSWAKKPKNHILSMAQIRATSKAFRLALGYIMRLAGFESIPLEEIEETTTTSETETEIDSKIDFRKAFFGRLSEWGLTGKEHQRIRHEFYRRVCGTEEPNEEEQWKKIFDACNAFKNKEEFLASFERARPAALPKNVRFVVKDDALYVYTPYDEKFISFAHEKEGKWNAPLKAWQFPLDVRNEIEAFFTSSKNAKKQFRKREVDYPEFELEE